jgi:serine/threonine-protein kinase HipA
VDTEDFAQVFGGYPSEKYVGAAYHNIAAALISGISFDAAIEFDRRLAFAVITGNGDMHLKNWSLLYPGDGRTPVLAPVYDVLSTIPNLPKDGLALSLAGEKSFKAPTPERWRDFANRSRLPEGAVITAVAETAAAVRHKWPLLPERDVMPAQVLERIDAHMDEMARVLDP